jgi:hypothetical protein
MRFNRILTSGFFWELMTPRDKNRFSNAFVPRVRGSLSVQEDRKWVEHVIGAFGDKMEVQFSQAVRAVITARPEALHLVHQRIVAAIPHAQRTIQIRDITGKVIEEYQHPSIAWADMRPEDFINAARSRWSDCLLVGHSADRRFDAKVSARIADRKAA